MQVFLARSLGLEHFGVYSYVLTWIVVGAAVSRMGIDTMVLRFVAAYQGREEWALLRLVLQTATRLVLITGLVGALLVVAIAFLLRDSLSVAMFDSLVVSSGLLLVLSVFSVRQAALRALGQVVAAVAAEFILIPLGLIVLTAAYVVAASQPLTAATALGFHTGAALIALAVLAVRVRRGVAGLPASDRDVERRMGEWLGLALPSALMASFAYLNAQTDLLMIGTLLGPSEVGLYTAAVRLSSLVLWGLFAVTAVVTPVFARLHARNEYDQLRQKAAESGAAIAIITIPLALAVTVLGPSLLWLFGGQFQVAYPALAVLVLAFSVNAFSGPVGFLMTMTGHQREAAIIIVFGAIANVILNLSLIPRLGLIGAAMATGISNVLWNGALIVRTRKHLKADPTIVGALTLLRRRPSKKD